MKWIATGSYASIEEMVVAKSGISKAELLEPKWVPPAKIQNLEAALDLVKQSISSGMPITVVGDYDADGITSTTILTKLLRRMGAEPETIIPRRFTEGYGISEQIIRRITPGLIVTIDNGIMAVDEVALARSLGSRVIVIDHHLPGETLPEADVLVDPHVSPERNGYAEYCGAGLALKLAEAYMANQVHTEESKAFLMELYVWATIGTLADVMPLTGDNRYIVKTGLAVVREQFNSLSVGLRHLILGADAEAFDEETVSFKIAPLLNAPGRLYNAGGTSVLKALLCEDLKDSLTYTQKLKQINDKRKELTTKTFALVCETIEQAGDHKGIPICAYAPKLPEGLVGLITGKLTERYKRPTFLFTDGTEEGILKGSGRSYGDFDLKPLVDAVGPVVERAGGHSGAAGITLRKENFEAMAAIMRQCATQFPQQEPDVMEYDMAIRSEDVASTLQEIKRYAPFGAGVPRPRFAILDFTAVEASGEHFRIMGSGGEHLKLNGPGFSAVGFGMANEYQSLGLPSTLSLLGVLGENVFRGNATPQMMLEQIKAK